jgi:hypothetical protein
MPPLQQRRFLAAAKTIPPPPKVMRLHGVDGVAAVIDRVDELVLNNQLEADANSNTVRAPSLSTRALQAQPSSVPGAGGGWRGGEGRGAGSTRPQLLICQHVHACRWLLLAYCCLPLLSSA